MKTKKTKQKDLENKKVLFFEIGLAISLLLAFMAFEIKTEKQLKPVLVFDNNEVEPMVPITIDNLPKPEPISENKKLAMLITDNIEITELDFPDIKLFTDPSMLDTSKYRPMVRVVMPEEVDPNEVIPIYDVQKKPTFRGKEANTFVNWVYGQIEYPAEAVKNNIYGTVYIGFVIDKKGKLANIQNMRSPDPLLFDEVARVVQASPDWEPGMQGTRPVNVSYQINISFKLQ